MLSKIYSSGVLGIEGFEVTVECSAWDRLPRFELVGLPDAAVKEAKNRVQSACENSGYVFPALDLMINLAPADIKKMCEEIGLTPISAHMNYLEYMADMEGVVNAYAESLVCNESAGLSQ